MKQPVCAAAAAVDGAVGDAVGKFVACWIALDRIDDSINSKLIELIVCYLGCCW